MNSYELSRKWFDFSFENPHKIKPYHSAIYFFAIEHCNRLGWKKIFGFPTSMVLEAIGMKSYGSYKKYLNDLVDFGFIKVHEYSKNQYSSNIIELTLNVKALDKALDKAFIKHGTKQEESTEQSIDSIDKPIYNKPINKEQYKEKIKNDKFYLEQLAINKRIKLQQVKEMLDRFHLGFSKEHYANFDKYKFHWFNWYNKNKPEDNRHDSNVIF